MRSLTWEQLDQEFDDDREIDLIQIDKYTRAHLFARAAHLAGGLPNDLLKTAGSSADLRHWSENRTAGHRDGSDAFTLDVDEVRFGDVALRAVRPDDLGPLYELATEPSTAHRWRFRGQLVSFDHFLATFDENVLVQMIAVDTRTGTPLSLNVLYGWEPLNQVVSFGYIGMGGGNDLSFERTLGVALTLSYAFSRWPIRTIYGEIPGYNQNVIEGLPADVVVQEGRLSDYFFYDGRWWDKLIIAIHRDPWTRYAAQFRADVD